MLTLVIGTALPIIISVGSVVVVLAYRPRPVAFVRPTAVAPCRTLITPR